MIIKRRSMLSKARIKLIKSLQVKKYRKQEQCFVVEGGKSVLEILGSDFEVAQLFVTPEFLSQNRSKLSSFKGNIEEAMPKTLAEAGEYSTNDSALAIVKMRPNVLPSFKSNEFVLMLDDIRDPGNLGAIIRTADWYGIHTIIASPESADVYNSKVIQSSMGSFTRVNIFYTYLPTFLVKNKGSVFGAFLTGSNAHSIDYGSGGIVIIGNEASGISAEVENFITHKISIPKYGKAESLNAAIATAVICDNIMRSRS